VAATLSHVSWKGVSLISQFQNGKPPFIDDKEMGSAATLSSSG
jgi:hypothetical protein